MAMSEGFGLGIAMILGRMLQWDKKLIGQMERKRHHYFFGITILSMIITSLFMAVPQNSVTKVQTRPISMEEEQGIIAALDHLSETLPSQSLTIQNWMNKITDGKIEILVSDSEDGKVEIENNTLFISPHFFQEDPISQQKNLSDAFGMRFDFSKAAEIAFSKE